MHYVISYDIPNDQRRLRLAKALLDFGDRVQYSVFEATLDKRLFDKLLKRIDNIIDVQEDSVRIYPMCAECETRKITLGQGPVSGERDVYIL